MTNVRRQNQYQAAEFNVSFLMTLIREWLLLTRQRFPPLKYALYSSLFVAAIQKASLVSPAATLNFWNAPAVVGTFLLLWFMRVVDEIKDLEEDRRFNPDRPLASGEVTLTNTALFLVLLGVLILAIAMSQTWASGLFATAIMSYSLLLLAAEKRFKWFANSMIVNVLFAVQLKTMIVFYIWSALPHDADHPSLIPIGVVAAAVVCCYLHWEILRKTRHDPTEQKSYSNAIGTGSCLALGTILLLASIFLIAGSSPLPFVFGGLLAMASTLGLMAVIGFSFKRIDHPWLSAASLSSYLFFLLVLSFTQQVTAAFS